MKISKTKSGLKPVFNNQNRFAKKPAINIPKPFTTVYIDCYSYKGIISYKYLANLERMPWAVSGHSLKSDTQTQKHKKTKTGNDENWKVIYKAQLT